MDGTVLTAPPALPRRALVVADTALAGSNFGRHFDELHIIAPEELASSAVGAFPVVVISGRAAYGGQLAEVVARTLERTPADVLLALDASDRPAWSALRADPGPLAGLTPIGVQWVAQRPCVLLRRAADPSAPRLEEADAALTALLRAGPQPVPVEARAPDLASPTLESPALVRELRQRLEQVSRELAVAHTALAEAQVKPVPTANRLVRFVGRGRMAVRARGLLPVLRSKTVRRMVLPIAAACFGLLVLVGISILTAALTGTGVRGAAETGALLFLVPVLLYLVRGVRRAGRNSAQTQRLAQRIMDAQLAQQRERRRFEQGVERYLAAGDRSPAQPDVRRAAIGNPGDLRAAP